jgi:hypothetical protein
VGETIFLGFECAGCGSLATRPRRPTVVVSFQEPRSVAISRVFDPDVTMMSRVETVQFRAVQKGYGNRDFQVRWYDWEPVVPASSRGYEATSKPGGSFSRFSTLILDEEGGVRAQAPAPEPMVLERNPNMKAAMQFAKQARLLVRSMGLERAWLTGGRNPGEPMMLGRALEVVDQELSAFFGVEPEVM